MLWLILLRSPRFNPSVQRRIYALAVGLCLGVGMNLPASAKDLRVGLGQGLGTVTVGSSTPATLLDGQGRGLGQMPALQGMTATPTQGGITLNGKKAWQMILKPQEQGLIFVGDRTAAAGGRWYRGTVRLIRSGDGITIVNQLNLEDYVASVVGKEMYPTWPQAALQAQAVAARSYALYQQQRPKFKFFDVLNTTTSQVYAGLDGEAESTQKAAQSTAGKVLTYQGKIIESVFHSASGGHTENSENVWVKPVAYLRGVPDFDQAAPVFQWTVTLSAAQLRQRLPGVGDIVSLVPTQTSPTGRIQTLKVQGNKGSFLLKGSDARRALGLRSTLFTIKPEFGTVAAGQKVAHPTGFQITGQGSGHGLGMSQWGAYALALQGKSYPEILAHYYRGASLKKLY